MSETPIQRWQREHGWSDEQMEAAQKRFVEQYRKDMLAYLAADPNDEDASRRFRESKTGQAMRDALARKRAEEGG